MAEELARLAGTSPGPALFLAEAFGTIGDTERALQFTRRVLRADPDNAQAMGLEARLHHAAGRYEDAAGRAIDSLALIYFQPWLHCLLGQVLEVRRARAGGAGLP